MCLSILSSNFSVVSELKFVYLKVGPLPTRASSSWNIRNNQTYVGARIGHFC